jgi:hypothetical protein
VVTSPLASVGLTYDGTDLQPADLSFHLQIVKGLNETPQVRGIDVTVPALAGRVEANRINDVLPIVLEGFCRADPATTTQATARSSYRDKVQVLRALFSPTRARANLVASLEDGTTITISARPLPGMIWNELVLSEFALVSIELEGVGDWA